MTIDFKLLFTEENLLTNQILYYIYMNREIVISNYFISYNGGFDYE